MPAATAAAPSGLKVVKCVMVALLCSSCAYAARDMSLFGGQRHQLTFSSRSLAETVSPYGLSPSMAAYGGYGMPAYGVPYGPIIATAPAPAPAPAPASAPGPMPGMADFPLPAPVFPEAAV